LQWEVTQLNVYRQMIDKQRLSYPDPDLMQQLIELYFQEMNIYSPVLHRPTFEEDVRNGLHLRDSGFGAVLLLVCALGARYTDDPRVFLDPAAPQSAGWDWYNQIEIIRKSPLAPPRLYDVQQYCASIFSRVIGVCSVISPHPAFSHVPPW
jgi:hypothetical protein